jgi:hypothetical protein
MFCTNLARRNQKSAQRIGQSVYRSPHAVGKAVSVGVLRRALVEDRELCPEGDARLEVFNVRLSVLVYDRLRAYRTPKGSISNGAEMKQIQVAARLRQSKKMEGNTLCRLEEAF